MDHVVFFSFAHGHDSPSEQAVFPQGGYDGFGPETWIHHEGKDVHRATTDVVTVANAVAGPTQGLVEQVLNPVRLFEILSRPPGLESVLDDDLVVLPYRN